VTTNPLPLGVGPTAPKLGTKDLAQQFWADAYGKEVQTAATYSYTWLADQFGHLAIGIVAAYLATSAAGWIVVAFQNLTPGAPQITFVVALVLGWTLALISLLAQMRGGWLISLIGFLGPLAASWWIAADQWRAAVQATHTNLLAMLFGLGIAVIGSSLWEVRAYLSSVKKSTGTFQLDAKLLRDNAIIATVYMALGSLLCFASLVRTISWPDWFPSSMQIPPLVVSWFIWLAAIVFAIVLAVPWLRQKITWQKAALPYLSRLANVTSRIAPEDATALQALVEGGTPRLKPPRQIVIGGPIGSGRTEMAAGIGTEFAFKDHKVRYISLNRLLEFAASFSDISPEVPDDSGPTTIGYWPWSESQVVIIDDIGPLIAAQEPRRQANLAQFSKLLDEDLKSIAGVLAQCHTIWVLGDLRPRNDESGTPPSALVEFAKIIALYCSSPGQPSGDPIIIELEKPAEPAAARKPKSAIVRSVKLVELSRSDKRHTE
jgi:hypothetical protein